MAGEVVVLPPFRLRTGDSTGECGGVTRAAGIAAELEADDDMISFLSGVGERSGVLLASGVSLTSTMTELEADKADTLDDALDRASESVGDRSGVVDVGSVIGIIRLTTGAVEFNGRCRNAGRGEGGGVRSLLLEEVDAVEYKACLLFL